jgi:flagellar hook-associated protein 1 FlgK
MSLTTAISNALSGIKTVQTDIQVISSNITNASRDNYTRKGVVLGNDVASGGVRVIGYSRATSDNIARLHQQSLATDGLFSTQNDYMNRIQVLFGSTQDSPLVTTTMAAFSASWRELSAAPEDTTRQQDVIFKGQNFAREIRRLADGIDKIEQDIKNDTATAITDLNNSLARIKTLNDQIVSAQSAGQSAGDLMDERDKEVQKIASLTNINIMQRDQGRISIYTPGGYSLLDVDNNVFTWDGIAVRQNGTDVGALLSGGKIEALLGLLDPGSSPSNISDPGKATIYKMEQQLDAIVDLFTDTAGSFAVAYDSAATGTGELASGFFTGVTRYSFDVNAALLNNTSKLKQASASPVALDMDLSNRTISPAGLSLINASYNSFTDAIIYTHSQNLKQVEDQSDVYAAQKDDYAKRLQNETGVNVDEEVVRLTQLQNNYSATARVISTVQQMLAILDSLFQ